MLDSARTSSGKRYSHPALPKLTRISFRPRFSTALTKVPSRGKRLPVFCDRIGLMVFNGSPGLIGTSGYQSQLVWLLFLRRRLFKLAIGIFIGSQAISLVIRRWKRPSVLSRALASLFQANVVPLYKPLDFSSSHSPECGIFLLEVCFACIHCLSDNQHLPRV